LWNKEAGQPYVDGFRVTILSEGADGVTDDFSTDFFKSAAGAATAKLIEEGRLNKQDTVRYLALAFYDQRHAQAGPIPQFKTTEAPPDIPLLESRLSDFIEQPNPAHSPAEQAEIADIPIIMPDRVLHETREQAMQAGDDETGGILIGHLRRDSTIPEVFVEITAQIPAVHAPAEVNRLTFTPETWAAAQAAVDLRRSEEIYVGWWHLHGPKAICGDCPPEKKARCPLARGFLSADDRLLHRSVFPKAYSSALVLSKPGDESEFHYSLFGWRHGRIERRDFHVPGGATAAAESSISEET